MILNHTPPVEQYGYTGGFHQGEARLLLDAGHTEYGITPLNIPKVIHEKFTCTYYDHPLNEDCEKPLPDDLLKVLHKSDVYDEADATWTNYLLMEGEVFYMARGFYRLSLDLDPFMDPANYTPGGDDDTFDYWPSGMRLLYQLAIDLDELSKDFNDDHHRGIAVSKTRYLDRYNEVLSHAVAYNVPAMAGVVPLAPDDA
jgi:hypothetical protein